VRHYVGDTLTPSFVIHKVIHNFCGRWFLGEMTYAESVMAGGLRIKAVGRQKDNNEYWQSGGFMNADNTRTLWI